VSRKTRISLLLAAFMMALFSSFAVTEAAQTMKNALDARQQAMVAISALSGAGDLAKLETALGKGLDAGLTVNEIKEVLVQVYAYAGFPRSLNTITVFQKVLEARKAQGKNDPEGKEPSPLPTDRTSLEFGTENQTRLIGQPVGGGIYEFVPAIDQFLKAHLFGDIFQRDNLDWKHRELATIAILAAIPGVNPQLQGHLAIGMRNGLTEEQIRAAASVVSESLGADYGDNMNRQIDSVVKR